jgi:hypothetical protein
MNLASGPGRGSDKPTDFTFKPLVAALITSLTLSAAPVFAGNAPGGQAQASQPMVCPAVTTAAASISAEDAASLSFMREEEKLARDMYQALAVLWLESPVFANIVKSEQMHMDQMKCLLDAFSLADSASADAGKFNNADLQALYDSLSIRGVASLSDALRVGALIEETDIADLDKTIATTQVPEIKLVYGNLRKDSENHLRAFVGALEQQGETYAAQVLCAEQLAAILTPAAPPAAFDLGNGILQIPAMRLTLNGQLLPAEETYRVELRLNPDGQSLQVMGIQRAQSHQ